jgi:hypothetical protein
VGGLAVNKWSWCTAEWNSLPETLEKLEHEGWVIFAVCPIGETQRYVHVVYRKEVL